MNKKTIKTNLSLVLQAVCRNVATVIILTLVVITTAYVYAAFTEPAVGPASSDQDFAQNILGANNANNAFDSSTVAANADGSIVERLEYLENNMF